MIRRLKLLAILLSITLVITMIPSAAFAAEDSSTTEPVQTGPIVSFSIDKILMSETESATITIEMAEGYNAKYISINRPITDNTNVVPLHETSEGIYTGKFEVNDQTESGIWKVRYLAYTEKGSDNLSDYRYIYNSDTYTGPSFDKIDFSSMDFEVVGTNADVTAPKLKNYTVDKTVVSQGEKITFTINIEDEHLPTRQTSISLQYRTPSGDYESMFFKKVDDNGIYKSIYNITEQTEKGIWKPTAFYLEDANENSVIVNNSADTSYGTIKEDLSSLNFEVVSSDDPVAGDTETFIVIFKDGHGKILSTQKVLKGESAVEPTPPTNELYLFDGWDSDFTNITSNKVINAKWKLNPDIEYDKEAHIGGSFNIEVYSTTSQNYTITCSEDIDFTSKLVSSGIVFTDRQYYSKEYEISGVAPGSYLFYVKGTWSSNTLTYKVKVTPHDWETELSVDKPATCTKDGSKSIHCSVCDAIKPGSEIAIPKKGHQYGEWSTMKAPTCIDFGSDQRKCSACGNVETRDVNPKGHIWDTEMMVDKEPTCTEEGSKSIHCKVCHATKDGSETAIPKIEHKYSEWVITKQASCIEEGIRERTCVNCNNKDTEAIKVIAHTPDMGTITQATIFTPGSCVTKCSVCEEVLDTEILYYNKNWSRYSGNNRYETSIAASNALKESLGVDKFDNVIVATGDNYPDALTGCYLAKVKKAPILLVDDRTEAVIKEFIRGNLNKTGKVYLLGGPAVINSGFESSLKKSGYNVERLSGNDRYDTNLSILKEAGVNSEDLLVCTGNGYADSLSASAVGKPIILVDETLSKTQKTYLDGISTNKSAYLIGGADVVKANFKKEFEKYAVKGVSRLEGPDRYATSKAVADNFFKKSDYITIAYGLNFPDGLSGGPLAMSVDAPLILVDEDTYQHASTYVKQAGVKKTVVFGGIDLIEDAIVNKIIQ